MNKDCSVQPNKSDINALLSSKTDAKSIKKHMGIDDFFSYRPVVACRRKVCFRVLKV